HRGKMSGLGESGDGNGRGVYLQTILAVSPESREVLGCAWQRPFMRVPAPKGEPWARLRRCAQESASWSHCGFRTWVPRSKRVCACRWPIVEPLALSCCTSVGASRRLSWYVRRQIDGFSPSKAALARSLSRSAKGVWML